MTKDAEPEDLPPAPIQAQVDPTQATKIKETYPEFNKMAPLGPGRLAKMPCLVQRRLSFFPLEMDPRVQVLK